MSAFNGNRLKLLMFDFLIYYIYTIIPLYFMNKARRQELEDVIDYLDDAIDRLEEIRDDEEDSYDNLNEGLQNSKTGAGMLDAISQLDGFCADIQDIKGRVTDMMLNKKPKKGG